VYGVNTWANIPQMDFNSFVVAKAQPAAPAGDLWDDMFAVGDLVNAYIVDGDSSRNAVFTFIAQALN